jgi:HTH-type transcriptional regulator, competence development regulator
MAKDKEKPADFGATIQALRKEHGLTQRELAGELGIDFTYLSKLENNRGERPSEKLVRQLAERLEADVEELLALAGRMPEELGELAQADVTFARLLRRLPNMDEADLRKVYRQAKVDPPGK